MLRIYKASTYDDMSRKAAIIMAAQMTLKPDCVLGLATGSSPIGLYKNLIEWHRNGDLDFSQTKTVNLDEYKGLGPTDDQSYRYFMDNNLFSHVNIKPENIHLPDGLAANAEQECKRYNEIIDGCGGLDMQLLGIGHNGHIGFNEPGEAFERNTHLVTLSDSTINANRRFFNSIDDVPKHAYTMGIANIMQARRILIVVTGGEKSEIVQKAFFGPITPDVPASVLQLHKNVTLVGDAAALSSI